MNTERGMETKLRRVLVPVVPRKGYAAALKERILAETRMPVILEKSNRVREIVTFTTLGLGAVASVAAVATIGGMMAGLFGSGVLLLGAAKSGMAQKRTHTQTA
jgi:hypothetical protein